MNQTVETAKPKRALATRSGNRSKRWLKWIRRGHLYTGLILLPWVIFFGFSGMLFNHPEWFGPVEIISRSGAVLENIEASVIADEVIENINERSPGAAFQRSNTALTNGTLNFETEAKAGKALVILSPNSGVGEVRQFVNETENPQPSFSTDPVLIESFSPSDAVSSASAVLAEAGVQPNGPLKPSERGGATVRFVMDSPISGESWNVAYSLMTGAIAARPRNQAHGMDFYSVVSRLHKTHHYPDRKGARWLWSLFADATGITMIFWGVSGLIMWWHLKPTRVMGMAGLTFAVLLAVFIFSGTFSDLVFVPRESRGGPPRTGQTEPPKPEAKPEPPIVPSANP